MRVLVVEDHAELAETIGDFLELKHHQVDYAGTGELALSLVKKHEFDAILLDINLPRKDGLSVCREIRDSGNPIPILMLTARTALTDIVTGFEQGADDYLVKPFELEEVLVRLKAITLRGRRNDTGLVVVADLELDLLKQTALRAGRHLKLNTLQFTLLKTLALASPGIVTRQTLETIIWQDEPPESGALRMHIHRLRTIVDADSEHALIETVRGQGFRICV